MLFPSEYLMCFLKLYMTMDDCLTKQNQRFSNFFLPARYAHDISECMSRKPRKPEKFEP